MVTDPATTTVDLLVRHGMRLGAAESLTGGLFGASLARCCGAGDVFQGSIVAYASEVKYRLLEVPSGPVVSAAAAAAMATSARRLLLADVGVSLTGVAGPEEQDGQPVGTVFVGVDAPSVGSKVARVFLSGSPDEIREQSAAVACELVTDAIRAVHSDV